MDTAWCARWVGGAEAGQVGCEEGRQCVWVRDAGEGPVGGGHAGEGHAGGGHEGEGHAGEGHASEGHEGEGPKGEVPEGEGHAGEVMQVRATQVRAMQVRATQVRAMQVRIMLLDIRGRARPQIEGSRGGGYHPTILSTKTHPTPADFGPLPP